MPQGKTLRQTREYAIHLDPAHLSEVVLFWEHLARLIKDTRAIDVYGGPTATLEVRLEPVTAEAEALLKAFLERTDRLFLPVSHTVKEMDYAAKQPE